MASYRDGSVTYRQASLYYRGSQPVTPAIPGIDLDRLDYIQVYVVDKFGNRLAPCSAAVIKKCQWLLNGAGQAELDLSQMDPGARRLLLMENELQIVFTSTNPHEIWWGVPIRRKMKPGQQSITCEELLTYFKTRIIEHASATFTDIDQFDIAWSLIQTAQTGTNYDRNIGASYTPSGYRRSRQYARDQHKIIFDLLMEFNADVLLNGFDQDVLVYETGERLWTPFYPARGSWYQGYLQWGKDIVDYEFDDDCIQMRTKIYCTGGSDGTTKFEQSYEDVASSAKYGAMVGTVSDGSEKDLGWLLAKAQQQVAVRSKPIATHSIVVTMDKLGKIHPGDKIWVIVDNDATQINAPFRVQSITWQQNETLKLDFVPPNLSGFVTPGQQPPL